MELHSEALGVRMVRADTIEQVWWDVKRPEFMTIGLSGGQEVRQDVRAGFPSDDIEEDEAADLCTSWWSASPKPPTTVVPAWCGWPVTRTPGASSGSVVP
uniref:Uncharacterized protein n=1 Tax=Streptomyces sp. NBC_00119 TaxID=2975659 RepID=A0AAU1UM97_9ACTN